MMLQRKRLVSSAELSWVRRIIASLAIVPWTIGAWSNAELRDPRVTVGLLFASLMLLQLSGTISQIFSRAVLLATLAVGLAHFHWSSGWDLRAHFYNKDFGAVAALIALLALGGGGLSARPDSVFAPVRLRGTLLGVVIVGAAQWILLALCLIQRVELGHGLRIAFVGGIAALLGIAVVASYRLRTWGLGLLWLSSAFVSVLEVIGSRRVFGRILLDASVNLNGFRWAWMGLVAVQAVLALVLIGTIARDRFSSVSPSAAR